MNIEKAVIKPSEISGCWTILNPLLQEINYTPLKYNIVSSDQKKIKYSGPEIESVFFLHSLGGSLNDFPGLDEEITQYTKLIRTECFGVENDYNNIKCGTFGDVCAYIHNTKQTILNISDKLNLNSYGIIGFSWGGFIAAVAALRDERCKKCMIISSTPDICDALQYLNKSLGITEVPSVGIGYISLEAKKAKFGIAIDQTAWDFINTWEHIINKKVRMLIYNNKEDHVMRHDKIQEYIEYCRNKGCDNIEAEFLDDPALPPHDLPLTSFSDRIKTFFFPM